MAKRLYGLIGRTLGHSFSAGYFARKFAADASLSDCEYRNFELATIDCLPQMLAENPDLCGFNVTIPYKCAIFPYLDEISAEAREIGAVNCVKIVDGRLCGYNTDVDGIRATLDLLIGGARPATLLLGTGGASQAVQYVLAERGVEYAIVSRDPMRGNMTYDQIDERVMSEVGLVINATPVGTFPNVDEAPEIPYDLLGEGDALFDLVYNPPVTRFLALGAERGAQTVNGQLMLERQAERAWVIWNE